MRRVMWLLVVSIFSISMVGASPAKDLQKYKTYFKNKFPNVEDGEFINGIYAIDDKLRVNWEEIEEFPPYEIAIEGGAELWNKPFQNGESYATCFGEPGVKHKYPYWDADERKVITLELAINQCRQENDEAPLKYKKGKMADLSAYMAFESRDHIVNIKIDPSPASIAAYENGKKHFFSRRGQLNFSCAHCHLKDVGMNIRSNRLSMARGHTTHFPVYRSKWGGIGTLHRRYAGCNKQVRAKPFKAQSTEYRNLEYFHTFMSNGLKWNGPGTRQ